MKTEEIKLIVHSVLNDKFNIPIDFCLDDTCPIAESFGLSSLEFIMFVYEIEQRCNIEFEFDIVSPLMTYGEFIDKFAATKNSYDMNVVDGEN